MKTKRLDGLSLGDRVLISDDIFVVRSYDRLAHKMSFVSEKNKEAPPLWITDTRDFTVQMAPDERAKVQDALMVSMLKKAERAETLMGTEDRRLTEEENAEVQDVLLRVVQAWSADRSIASRPAVTTATLFRVGYLLTSDNEESMVPVMAECASWLFDVQTTREG